MEFDFLLANGSYAWSIVLWSVVDMLSVTPLEKTYFPHSRSWTLIVFWLGVDLEPTSLLLCWDSVWFQHVQVFCCCHSLCESMCAPVLLCLENVYVRVISPYPLGIAWLKLTPFTERGG